MDIEGSGKCLKGVFQRRWPFFFGEEMIDGVEILTSSGTSFTSGTFNVL